MYKKIISKAPGRICLFGDHQDYLGLPIIATTINSQIKIEATQNKYREFKIIKKDLGLTEVCLLYTSPSPRDVEESRMPSSA